MNWTVTRLSLLHRAVLGRHFLALDNEDRRLRFCTRLPDATVLAYVARIDFVRDAVFGVFDEVSKLIGVAHVAFPNADAEAGVSVLCEHRNRGIGNALLTRTVLHARNRGVRALLLQCLPENAAMLHMASKQGVGIRTEHGEAYGRLGLPPADDASRFEEKQAQRAAILDYALESQVV
jgi:GNAT superfamily N-acetyltransferase